MMNDSQNQNKATEENSDSTLFGVPTEPVMTLNERRKKNLLKKQRRTIIILTALVAATLLAYFFIVLPIVNRVDEVPEETVELLDGEALAANNRILLFEHCERADIEKIEVHNEHGEFGFYHGSDGDFHVTGHPEALYDSELFASLVVSTGYAISTERLHKDCENMEEYGLADSQSPAYYTLTTREGAQHTVYIGDRTPSGSGYYARYAGRNAVYVLGQSIGRTVMQPLENMITPLLAPQMSETDYFTIKDFTVFKGDEKQVTISYFSAAELSPDELASPNALGAYKMLYPTSYAVNTVNYAVAIDVFMNFQGSRTVNYAPSEDELDAYGLLAPAYRATYKYQGTEHEFCFSRLTENNTYYVYSKRFNLIAEVDRTEVDWLEWDLLNWVDSPLFMININDVKTITVEGDGKTRVYELEGSGEELVVTEKHTGFKPEVKNFRQFYRTLITTNLQGYVWDDLTADAAEALTKDTPYLTLTVETHKAQTMEFKFYPYSTRRAYYTLNGEGEFYVLRDMATKIISDSEKVMTNTEIDAEANS